MLLRLTPSLFNGFKFQQQDRVRSDFDPPYDLGVSGISTNSTDRYGKRPKYSGKIFGGDTKVINVTLNNLDADYDSLVIGMDVEGLNQHRLFANDQLGNLWYVDAICRGLNEEGVDKNTGTFAYIFDCDDPTWTRLEAIEDTWNITALNVGDSHIIDIIGNQNAFATFTLTPGAPAGYYPYSQYVKNVNPIYAAQVDGIDITNGGWDTAALVTAGKMLSSGDDLRVIMDGAEIPRWFGTGANAINQAATKVFIKATWKPVFPLPLRTAIANSATVPAKLEWKVNANVKKFLKTIPVSGTIRYGNEEFTYSNRNVQKCEAICTGRQARGTSFAGHAVGDNGYWIEHDIRVIYGDSAAEAPVYDDSAKPVFDLTSTNASRVYTVFADTNNLRVGSWIRQVLNDGLGKVNRVYSGNHGAIPEVDPATDMGMEIDAYQVEGRWKPETAELAWQYGHPAGIASITPTGEKFKALSNTTWPANAELQSSPDGVKWLREWNEGAPPSANTWTALTNDGVLEAMPAGTKFVRFHFQGSVNAVVDNLARLEIHGATVALNSANVIQTGLNGEIASVQFAAIVSNLTTGESLIINYPAAEDTPLVINCPDMEVTYKGMNAIRALSWDTVRTDWLKLVPGPNELLFISPTTGDVTFLTEYFARAT